MGGSKRKSMAQMEKTQLQQDNKGDAQAGKKQKTPGKSAADKRPRGLNTPEVNDPKILAEVKKMGAITPYAVASQFNLRLSIAKDLLEELEKKHVVSLVGGNARVRIYQSGAVTPAAA